MNPKLTDLELKEVIDSYEGLGVRIGTVKENEIRTAFNQKVKDNHPDSTQDQVLKRLFEDKLKEYIRYRDVCLKTWNISNLEDQVEAYKVRKKITATMVAYYNKTKYLRYAFGMFVFLYGMYYFLDLKSLFNTSPKELVISNPTPINNKASNNPDPKIKEPQPEVASASSLSVPNANNDPSLYPAGVEFLTKYAYNKSGLTIKEKPAFDSKTLTILPYGTKLTVKMTKNVIKLNNTHANWYYVQEVDGFTLGEYLVGTEPDDSSPLVIIEDTIKNSYTTNINIKFGSNVLSLSKNKAFYFPSRNDKDPTEMGVYTIKGNEIHIRFDESEILLKYKTTNEYEIISAKY